MSSAAASETMNWLLITSNSEKMPCLRRLPFARHRAWRCSSGKE
jgi:hypothetical protein